VLPAAPEAEHESGRRRPAVVCGTVATVALLATVGLGIAYEVSQLLDTADSAPTVAVLEVTADHRDFVFIRPGPIRATRHFHPIQLSRSG
jgi:hypothetical protein